MAAVKMFGDELVTRGTSFVRDYTLHTKRQRLIKFFKIVHMMSVHVIQDFADSNFELISIGYVGLLAQQVFDMRPQVLYWIQVGTVAWPR